MKQAMKISIYSACAFLLIASDLLNVYGDTTEKSRQSVINTPNKVHFLSTSQEEQYYQSFLEHYGALKINLSAHHCYLFSCAGNCLIEGVVVLPTCKPDDGIQSRFGKKKSDLQKGFCDFHPIPPFGKYSISSIRFEEYEYLPEEKLISHSRKDQLGFVFEGNECTSRRAVVPASSGHGIPLQFREVLIDSAYNETRNDNFQSFIIVKLHCSDRVLYGVWYHVLGKESTGVLPPYGYNLSASMMGYIIGFPYEGTNRDIIKANKVILPKIESTIDEGLHDPFPKWAWKYLQDDQFQAVLKMHPPSISSISLPKDYYIPYSLQRKKEENEGDGMN